LAGLPKRQAEQGTVSPVACLHKLRINCAKLRLASGFKPVQEVCCQAGYEDTAFFRKFFKRYTGLAPKGYKLRFASRHAAGEVLPNVVQVPSVAKRGFATGVTDRLPVVAMAAGFETGPPAIFHPARCASRSAAGEWHAVLARTAVLSLFRRAGYTMKPGAGIAGWPLDAERVRRRVLRACPARGGRVRFQSAFEPRQGILNPSVSRPWISRLRVLFRGILAFQRAKDHFSRRDDGREPVRPETGREAAGAMPAAIAGKARLRGWR